MLNVSRQHFDLAVAHVSRVVMSLTRHGDNRQCSPRVTCQVTSAQVSSVWAASRRTENWTKLHKTRLRIINFYRVGARAVQGRAVCLFSSEMLSVYVFISICDFSPHRRAAGGGPLVQRCGWRHDNLIHRKLKHICNKS